MPYAGMAVGRPTLSKEFLKDNKKLAFLYLCQDYSIPIWLMSNNILKYLFYNKKLQHPQLIGYCIDDYFVVLY